MFSEFLIMMGSIFCIIVTIILSVVLHCEYLGKKDSQNPFWVTLTVANWFAALGLCFYFFAWPINYLNEPARIECEKAGGQYYQKHHKCFTEVEVKL